MRVLIFRIIIPIVAILILSGMILYNMFLPELFNIVKFDNYTIAMSFGKMNLNSIQVEYNAYFAYIYILDESISDSILPLIVNVATLGIFIILFFGYIIYWYIYLIQRNKKLRRPHIDEYNI